LLLQRAEEAKQKEKTTPSGNRLHKASDIPFYPEAETSPGKMLFQAATGAHAAWRMALMPPRPSYRRRDTKKAYRNY